MNPKAEKAIKVRAVVFDRMHEISCRVRELVNRGMLSPSSTVELLLCHWNSHPPTDEWMRNQGGLLPGNGGPGWRL